MSHGNILEKMSNSSSGIVSSTKIAKSSQLLEMRVYLLDGNK
jgi:hypothetical protein